MTTLFTGYSVKGHNIRNRVVVPPMVAAGFALEEGYVSEKNIQHYLEFARGGAGIVIVEATAIMKEERLHPFQLGIWNDSHISGLRRIASAIKSQGALSVIQIHHAGLLTPPAVNPVALGPSADEKNPHSRALTSAEIDEIRDSFIAAATRAEKSGFDGIELHGAHGYLLNQFACSNFNKRNDEYGKDLKGRTKLATEIILGIKKVCNPDLLISYRLGANSPSLEDGTKIAQQLEHSGIDLLHVSRGGTLLNLPRPPKEFNYNWIVYSGTEIKKQVGLPVIVVNEIKTPERASYLIENNLTDFIAMGRPNLADPAWTNHVKNQKPVDECLSCRPRCKWFENSELCPARKNR